MSTENTEANVADKLAQALRGMLASDPDGAIATAADANLEAAVNDHTADPIIRAQAAAVLNARKILAAHEAEKAQAAAEEYEMLPLPEPEVEQQLRRHNISGHERWFTWDAVRPPHDMAHYAMTATRPRGLYTAKQMRAYGVQCAAIAPNVQPLYTAAPAAPVAATLTDDEAQRMQRIESAVGDWLRGGCDANDIPRVGIAALVSFAGYCARAKLEGGQG